MTGIGKQWQRFVVVSDIHGDEADPKMVKAFHNFCDDYQPEIRVIAGDLWDFRPMRRGADSAERAESVNLDLMEGEIFIDKFKPTMFLRGNHDERLWDWCKDETGPLCDWANGLRKDIEKRLKGLKCGMLPYNKRHGIYKIGHLHVLHGYACGIYASRKHAQIYGSCMYGHTHAVDQHSIEGLEQRTALNIGCLINLEQEYVRAKPGALRWENGWAFGVVHKKTGIYHPQQVRRVDNRLVYPTEFREVVI